MMTHYKAHQGIHRASNKSHVCPICNTSFQRKHKLDEHLSQVHKTVPNVSKLRIKNNDDGTQEELITTFIITEAQDTNLLTDHKQEELGV